MAMTTKTPAPPTVLERFRRLTEGYLLSVAQRSSIARHPSLGTPPAVKRGLIHRLLPWLFLPGFRLTPWPIKRRLLRVFFLRKRQQWPERPWEKP